MSNTNFLEFDRKTPSASGSVFIHKHRNGSFLFGLMAETATKGDLLVVENSSVSLYDFMARCSHLMNGIKNGLSGPLFEGMQHVLSVAHQSNPFDVCVSSFRLATEDERKSYMLAKTVSSFQFHLQKAGKVSAPPVAKAAQTAIELKVKSITDIDMARKIEDGQRDFSKYKLTSHQSNFLAKVKSEESVDRPPLFVRRFGRIFQMEGINGLSLKLK